MYQQNHVGMHRSDDGGHSWTEITEGLPSEFGFAAATHPHDRDTFYVVPLDPGHGRCMPDGQAAVWRTRDAGESWQKLDERAAAARRAPRRAARGRWRSTPTTSPGLYFGTSTGQLFASADEGESWSELASYLPGISSVEVAVARLSMADVHLPGTLTPLFPGLPRHVDIEAATVREVIDELERRWPGLRDRLCEPGPTLAQHIHVYVDRERASLDTPLGRRSRVTWSPRSAAADGDQLRRPKIVRKKRKTLRMSRKIDAASNGATRMSLDFRRRWKSIIVKPAKITNPSTA